MSLLITFVLTSDLCLIDPLLHSMLLSSQGSINIINNGTCGLSSLDDYSKGDLSSVCPSVMAVVRFYSDEVVDWRALQRAAKLYPQLSVTTELCYNVELTGEHEAPEVSKEPADHDRLSVLPRCLSVRPTHPLQAAAVSVHSRRTFSSGCFARRCRRSRCLRRQS